MSDCPILSDTRHKNGQMIKEIGQMTGKIGQTLVLRNGSERIVLVGCGKHNETTVRQYKDIIKSLGA